MFVALFRFLCVCGGTDTLQSNIDLCFSYINNISLNIYKHQKEESRILVLFNTFVLFFLPQTSSADLLLRKEGEVA